MMQVRNWLKNVKSKLK